MLPQATSYHRYYNQLMTIPENADDILESALNKGVAYSAAKYNVSDAVVRLIVSKFKNEIDEPCSCEKEKVPVLCFACDKFSRINL